MLSETERRRASVVKKMRERKLEQRAPWGMEEKRRKRKRQRKRSRKRKRKKVRERGEV